jgi:hypothetical protein
MDSYRRTYRETDTDREQGVLKTSFLFLNKEIRIKHCRKALSAGRPFTHK